MKIESDLLQMLNDKQKEAVVSWGRPLLVLAGAGSGKTRVITHRIAYLILERGVLPENIVALTFTNKAASEMKHRLESMLGEKLCQKIEISTFHSLGLKILQAEKEHLGYAKGFVVYDTTDQLAVIRDILEEQKLAERRLDAKAILARISIAKNRGISPIELEKYYAQNGFKNEYDNYAACVYPFYQSRLKSLHAIDFDDLIIETNKLFFRNEEVKNKWNKICRHVFVDEFQDTSLSQLEMLRLIAGDIRSITVVGDDDQAIYSWRGANPKNILEFPKQYENVHIVKLEQNYRSNQEILEVANSVIAHNRDRFGKVLFSNKKSDKRAILAVCPTPEDEARFIVNEMMMLTETNHVPMGEIAVLYRSNNQARLLEEEFKLSDIPYKMIGGQTFFDRKEIRDAIAYLKLLLHPRDEIALRRVINYPKRGIGDASLEELTNFHSQKILKNKQQSFYQTLLDALEKGDVLNKSATIGLDNFISMVEQSKKELATATKISSFARGFFEKVGLVNEIRVNSPSELVVRRRLDYLESFIRGLSIKEEALIDLHLEWGERRLALMNYLHRLTLHSALEQEDERSGSLTLSTLHGAKGLEFGVVFLIGVEEEILPHKRTLYPNLTDTETTSASDLSEERRLFYVGITRAKRQLYFTRTVTRGLATVNASRFLLEIPESLLDIRNISGKSNFSLEEEEMFITEQLKKLKNTLAG